MGEGREGITTIKFVNLLEFWGPPRRAPATGLLLQQQLLLQSLITRNKIGRLRRYLCIEIAADKIDQLYRAINSADLIARVHSALDIQRGLCC